MGNTLDKVMIYDFANFNSKAKELWASGNLTIRDGVGYGPGGIVQHLPLKEANVATNQSVQQIVADAQGAMQATQLLTTGLILGAIVVQTIYLSKKLNKIQKTADLISQDTHSQNVIFFLEQITDYFGTLETAREYIADRELKVETEDIAPSILKSLSEKRNQTMMLAQGLINQADGLSGRHLDLMLDYINVTLDALPAAINLECQFSDRYEKFHLSERIMAQGSEKYNTLTTHYREWCNSQMENVYKGKVSETQKVFIEKKDVMKELFSSEHNKALLQPLPSMKQIQG